MVETIHKGVHRARKEYQDDGWELIQNCDRILEIYLTTEKPWRILLGDLYIRQFNRDGGDTWTWRTKSEFYDIINKYELFGDY